jgi:putative transposase
MKRKRHTEEQIIAILKEHEAGVKTADLCRKHGISEASFYNWKAKYGGLEISEAKRLKGLESENARLKKLLADAMLDNAALKDLLAKNGDARCQARGCRSPAFCVRYERCLSNGIATGISLAIVAKSFEFPTEMMRSNAGLHPDQARRHICKASLYLATRPLLTQHDRTAMIESHDVERVLPNIDANYGNRILCCCRGHCVLLVRAPLASLSLGGAGARPDHPISRHRPSSRAQVLRGPGRAAICLAVPKHRPECWASN